MPRSSGPTCSSSSSATATPRKAPRPKASPRSTARTSRCGGSWCARRGSRWSELLHLQVVLHLLHALDLGRHRGGLRALGFRLHRPGEVHHAGLGRDADVHHLERGVVVDGLLHPHGGGRVVEERVASRGRAAGEAEQRGSGGNGEAMLELAHFTLPSKSNNPLEIPPKARPAKEKPHIGAGLRSSPPLEPGEEAVEPPLHLAPPPQPLGL